MVVRLNMLMKHVTFIYLFLDVLVIVLAVITSNLRVAQVSEYRNESIGMKFIIIGIEV